MRNYLNLLRDTIYDGVIQDNRTEFPARFLHGATLRWNLKDGFPLVTTRPISFRIIFEETMLFLRGDTNTKILENKGINIWKGNTSREFLDSRGLSYLPEGDMGKGYSHQWRNFGGDWSKLGIDQVRNLLDGIQANPTDRRHIITAWNPEQVDEAALPPCHLYQQYTVNLKANELNSAFVIRSNDLYLGLPYNIGMYALLNHLFAAYLGYSPGELVYFGVNAHLYENQISNCVQQIVRDPQLLPELVIRKDILDDFHALMALQYDDVVLKNYNPLPALKPVKMAGGA